MEYAVHDEVLRRTHYILTGHIDAGLEVVDDTLELVADSEIEDLPPLYIAFLQASFALEAKLTVSSPSTDVGAAVGGIFTSSRSPSQTAESRAEYPWVIIS